MPTWKPTYPPLKPDSFRWGGGPRDHQSRPLGNWQSDYAWDLMCSPGTPVYALADGTVLKSYFSDNGRTVWGRAVTIQYDGGPLVFTTHLADAGAVAAGQRVKAGQLIGRIGNPPRFPAHLHIGAPTEALVNQIVNTPWPKKPSPDEFEVEAGGDVVASGSRFKVGAYLKEKAVYLIGKFGGFRVRRKGAS